MTISDRLLDYAERHAWIISLAAANLGFGIGSVLHHHWWGWPFIGFGLILIAIDPVGTQWRRRRLLPEIRRRVEDAGLADEAPPRPPRERHLRVVGAAKRRDER